MKSRRSKHFKKLLKALPEEVQEQAHRAYELFKADPHHKSLHFKEVTPRIHRYSVRIGQEYRALGIRDPKDTIVWTWIGHHDEYDTLLK